MHPPCAEKFVEPNDLDMDEFSARLVGNTGLDLEQVPKAFQG